MMEAIKDIYYVGVQDPDLRVFDIVMYSDYGTSYNSYLVRGATKTVLFETVKDKFFDKMIENIREVCDPGEIDYIVMNHTEPDHAGSLARLLELVPCATVVGSATAISFLREIINGPFNSYAVTEKDELDIGGMTLRFLSVPMLHWPDSQYTYIPERKALFTCDSFGCHYSDPRVFNDVINADFGDAYRYYFDNIIGPYKNPHMKNALNKIASLDIAFIGNGHGPVIRADPQKYLDMYRAWCEVPVRERKKVTIAYVSAYGYTRALANALADGVRSAGADVSLFDLVTDDVSAAAAAVASSDGFLLGSPTLIGDALPPVWQMLLHINPVIHKGVSAAAFGSYGWSGEAVPNLMARLKQLRLKTPEEGLRVRFQPTEADLDTAREYGKQFVEAM
ncbi:MAG: FprA family A-type flavoprotein [Clostridia bacterium]|nr:FprA family A-type flavoprotein [Clostridia bacterium]